MECQSVLSQMPSALTPPTLSPSLLHLLSLLPFIPISFPAFFMTWFLYVAQASLELSIHPPLPPMHWDYRCASPHLAEIWIQQQSGFIIALCFILIVPLTASIYSELIALWKYPGILGTCASLQVTWL